MARTKASTKEDDSGTVEILQLQAGTIEFCILGKTPLILNRMSAKVQKDLLYPSPKKNEAERAATMKHDPLAEYRATPYLNRDPKEPTLFHLPTGMFKQAMRTAALDIPGAFKSQIGRLVSMSTTQVNLYGKPTMRSDVVRLAGLNKTPDIRFRACLPEWACKFTLRYVQNRIKPPSLVNLLAFAGIACGVGDNRVEKGANDYGQFEIVGTDDPDWQRIVKTQARKVQELALESPEYYDIETEDLVSWFYEEVRRRRDMPAQLPKVARRAAVETMPPAATKAPRGRPRKNGSLEDRP